MGSRGPINRRGGDGKAVGKREEYGKPDPPTVIDIDGMQIDPLAVPDPDPDWHHIARAWYTSLRMSGQSRFYEPSDWATAWVAATALDAYVNYPYNAGILREFNQMAASLITTEGARRRVRVELNRTGQGDPDEAAANDEVAHWGEVLSGKVIA